MKTKLLSLFVALICASSAFAYDCFIDGIYYKLYDRTASVTFKTPFDGSTKYSSDYSGSVIIPEIMKYEGRTYSVVGIEHDAFHNCSSLTSITIPNSVKTIGMQAFSSCSGLTSVTIGNSVTSIGQSAFSSCSSLTSITIPNSVTTIENYAFNGCSGLTSIDVDAANTHYCSMDGVLFTYDKQKLIKYPTSNTRIEYTIPNSVTSIEQSAFSGCKGLASVTIGNSVTTIGNYAFYGCTSLTSVTIPNSVTLIGNYAFYNCTSLTSVTIPNSVTTIGERAFYGCTSLTSVTIPNSVMWIGAGAFFYVNNIVYNGTATGSPWGAKCVNGYIDGYLVYSDASKTILCGCSSAAIGDITIPNSVTTIGDYAFHDCSALTSITIPNSVTTIGEYAFRYCSGLTSITIPNSVTTIGERAFLDCTGLTSVTVHWTDEKELPIMGDDVFSSIANRIGPSAATLHVPAGTQSIYQTAEQWEDFGAIVSDTPTPLPNVLMNDAQPTMHKYFHNGNLIIERNGVKYTPAGQKIR